MIQLLQGENVTVRYGAYAAVNSLSFRLNEGQWLMLAGPNGAGKSTLIKAISQGVPYTGSICLHEKELSAMKPRQIARKIGFLAQQHHVAYAYTVEEVVGLGRYAYHSGFLSTHDSIGTHQIEAALEMTGLTGLRRASMLTLSGGEQQRVFLAQVFAQDPQILILDEPANHLDLKYQQHIFSLIRQWLAEPGRAVLSVVHDLSLARMYGTHAILMDHGKSISQGEIGLVMTPEHLNPVYGMDVFSWMQAMLSQWS